MHNLSSNIDAIPELQLALGQYTKHSVIYIAIAMATGTLHMHIYIQHIAMPAP